MFCQLITAKTNAATELLLLVDDKIVSQWPYEPVTQLIGDLRDWDNQSDCGRDLSDYQADFDAGRLELDQVLSEQCDLQEFWSEFELETLWFAGVGHPAGCALTHNTDTEDPEEYCDINDSLDFLGDLSCYWGGIRDFDTWEWDCSSGSPTSWGSNTIYNMKAFAKVQE